MGFTKMSTDGGGLPIACIWIPDVGWAAMQGSTLSNTDANSNLTTPLNTNLAQIGSIATQMASGDSLAAGNILVVVPGTYSGSSLVSRIRDFAAIPDNYAGSGVQAMADMQANAANNLDFRRGNLDNITLVNASGATTTQTSADQTNYNARGAVIVLNMTNVGTGSVTLTIQGKDPVSGQYYTILAGAAVTTNSVNVYRAYPGLTASANAIANDILPRTWRVQATANNANAATYKVAAILIV